MLFAEVERPQLDAVEQRKLQHLPPIMASQALKALAEITMDLIEGQAEQLRSSGSQMLWGALTSKPVRSGSAKSE